MKQVFHPEEAKKELLGIYRMDGEKWRPELEYICSFLEAGIKRLVKKVNEMK